MLRTLLGGGRRSAIGLELQGNRFYAVRLEFEDGETRLTHSVMVADLTELAGKIERAERVITRPPPNTFFNRRPLQLAGDWTDSSTLPAGERGLAVSAACARWAPFPAEQGLFGWRVLSHDKASNTSTIEVHQSERNNCIEFKRMLETARLGPVFFDAWHTTALDCVIPRVYDSFILETRFPSGYALVKDGALWAHLEPGVLSQQGLQHSERPKFRDFLAQHLEEKRRPLQAFFLERRYFDPRVAGLSCSWIGDNCAELLGEDLDASFLQTFGLAMSRDPEWLLHHVSDFQKGPGPLAKLKSMFEGMK